MTFRIQITGGSRYLRFVREFHDVICASTYAARIAKSDEVVRVEVVL